VTMGGRDVETSRWKEGPAALRICVRWVGISRISPSSPVRTGGGKPGRVGRNRRRGGEGSRMSCFRVVSPRARLVSALPRREDEGTQARVWIPLQNLKHPGTSAQAAASPACLRLRCTPSAAHAARSGYVCSALALMWMQEPRLNGRRGEWGKGGACRPRSARQ
jgi:hypothetical protein